MEKYWVRLENEIRGSSSLSLIRKDPIDLVNPKSFNFKKFSISSNNEISLKETQAFPYMLVGMLPIQNKRINRFTILKAESGRIDFGVVDSRNINDGNAYDAKSGKVWISGNTRGNGIPSKEGDTIVMAVFGNRITWSVGNELRGECTDSMLTR